MPRPRHDSVPGSGGGQRHAMLNTEAILIIVLEADHTQTLGHVAAALNIRVSGAHHLRFKLRGALRKYFDTLPSTNVKYHSSVTVAEVFRCLKSFANQL